MTVNLTIKFAGHRGYMAKEIENSRSAFSRAIKENLDYVEFDVRKTSDHIPILFHDKKLNRLILNKKGNVENYTLEDLKSCVYPDGQRILTLEEFFSIVDGQVDYILDLKVKGIEKKIIKLVRINNLEKRIIIQSQSKNIIKKLYKLAPDLDYALYRGYMGNLGKLGSILKLHTLLAYTFYCLNIKPYPIKYLSSDGPFLYQELTSLLNKKGNVENYTIEDLKSCFYPDGQRILTLEEFFSFVDGQVNYILDLKVKGIEKKIIELIRRYNLKKRIIIQSKSKNLIKKLYKLAPDLDYALYRGYMGNIGKLGSILKLHNLLAYTFYSLNIKPYPIKYLSSDGPFLYQELTSLLNKKGIKIILGSIRTHKYIKNIKRWNVEIITCNHVEYIRSLLKSYEKRL